MHFKKGRFPPKRKNHSRCSWLSVWWAYLCSLLTQNPMNMSEWSSRRKRKKATKTKRMQERRHQMGDNCLGKIKHRWSIRATGFLEQRSQQPRCPQRGVVLEEREDGPAHPRKTQRQKQQVPREVVGSGRDLRTRKMIQSVCTNADLPCPPPTPLSPPQAPRWLPSPTQTLRKQGIHASLSIAVPFWKGSSRPRAWTQVSCIAGGFLTIWATREDDEGDQGSLTDRETKPRERSAHHQIQVCPERQTWRKDTWTQGWGGGWDEWRG